MQFKRRELVLFNDCFVWISSAVPRAAAAAAYISDSTGAVWEQGRFKGCLSLARGRVNQVSEGLRDNTFEVIGYEVKTREPRAIHFVCDSAEERDSWMKDFNASIVCVRPEGAPHANPQRLTSASLAGPAPSPSRRSSVPRRCRRT